MKKVLIITYYWPPSGGPGVQRVLKFAKYLPQFGWQPIVLTVKNGEYPAIDETLKRDIPESCIVYKTKSIEPFSIYKLLFGNKKQEKISTFVMADSKKSFLGKLAKFIRANLFIPDARIGWYPSAVKNGIDIVTKEKIDMIYSSSPPHSLQLIARKIAKKTGVKWLADFRDPWSDFFIMSDNYETKLAKRISQNFERKVLQDADGFLTVSKFLANKYKNKTKKSYFLRNGYDDFVYNKSKSDKFRIKYIGSMSKLQVPDNFVKSVAKFEDLQIDFYGNFDSELSQSIERHNSRNINLHGYIPLDQVKTELVNSDLLLITIPSKNGAGILTGKLFQLMGSHNRILCICNDDNQEIREIISNAKIGKTFTYSDNLDYFIQNEINNWISDSIPEPDIKYIKQFHRKSLTSELVKIFNDLQPEEKS